MCHRPSLGAVQIPFDDEETSISGYRLHFDLIQ